MSLSESLAKFLPHVATALSSDEQAAIVAEIVDEARAIEGLPPLPKPVAPAAVDASATADAPAAGSDAATSETVQQ